MMFPIAQATCGWFFFFLSFLKGVQALDMQPESQRSDGQIRHSVAITWRSGFQLPFSNSKSHLEQQTAHLHSTACSRMFHTVVLVSLSRTHCSTRYVVFKSCFEKNQNQPLGNNSIFVVVNVTSTSLVFLGAEQTQKNETKTEEWIYFCSIFGKQSCLTLLVKFHRQVPVSFLRQMK